MIISESGRRRRSECIYGGGGGLKKKKEKKTKEQAIKLVGDLGIHERQSEIICKHVREMKCQFHSSLGVIRILQGT